MITADQLLCHAIGDYLIQTDWMAQEKVRRWVPAAAHALSYTLPFLFLSTNPFALLIIAGTHFLIDRYRLARYVIWAKNNLSPRSHRHPWRECATTGYHSDRPAWLTVWLLIIGDNVLHVICNGIALMVWP
jgi:hypothetical protein